MSEEATSPPGRGQGTINNREGQAEVSVPKRRRGRPRRERSPWDDARSLLDWLMPDRPRRRGRPKGSKAEEYSNAVSTIMQEQGVNITTAAKIYAERPPWKNPDAVLRAIAKYWREYEPDPNLAYDMAMTDVDK